MIAPKHYGLLDDMLGNVPKAYSITCLDCGMHEHLMVCKTFADEPYIEDHLGTRTVKKLPKVCPKCEGKHLHVINAPKPCD